MRFTPPTRLRICRFAAPNYPITKLHNYKIECQRGYVLLVLLLFVALLSIGFLAAIRSLDSGQTRPRGGNDSSRGAVLPRHQGLLKKFGRYPTRIEDLESTNNLRFLRRRYKDPLNRDKKTGKRTILNSSTSTTCRCHSMARTARNDCGRGYGHPAGGGARSFKWWPGVFGGNGPSAIAGGPNEPVTKRELTIGGSARQWIPRSASRRRRWHPSAAAALVATGWAIDGRTEAGILVLIQSSGLAILLHILRRALQGWLIWRHQAGRHDRCWGRR